MLNDFEIRNFFTFEALKLSGLKRINLITGKNNTGKTALLEALRIYASNGENTVINHILQQRGYFRPSWSSSYDGLFHRKSLNKPSPEITLGRLYKYHSIRLNKADGLKQIYEYLILDPNGNLTNKFSLESSVSADYPNDEAVFIGFKNDLFNLQKVWDEMISLTPMEDEVIKILQDAVEPNIVRIDVKPGDTKVRLKDEKNPVSLKSLGDGVQRILTIAIGLVAAGVKKGKLLLIDELEAGLHYSVQEKLWDLIFHYAKLWDIQVFATTHSNDCIKSFYYIGSKSENNGESFFCRLQYRRKGSLEAIPFEMEELRMSMELPIETR